MRQRKGGKERGREKGRWLGSIGVWDIFPPPFNSPRKTHLHLGHHPLLLTSTVVLKEGEKHLLQLSNMHLKNLIFVVGLSSPAPGGVFQGFDGPPSLADWLGS